MYRNSEEACRAYARAYTGDGCTELTCLYHGLDNQAIRTMTLGEVHKSPLIVTPITVTVLWTEGEPTDEAIAAFATHHMMESMGFGHRVSRSESGKSAVVSIYRD